VAECANPGGSRHRLGPSGFRHRLRPGRICRSERHATAASHESAPSPGRNMLSAGELSGQAWAGSRFAHSNPRRRRSHDSFLEQHRQRPESGGARSTEPFHGIGRQKVDIADADRRPRGHWADPCPAVAKHGRGLGQPRNPRLATDAAEPLPAQGLTEPPKVAGWNLSSARAAYTRGEVRSRRRSHRRRARPLPDDARAYRKAGAGTGTRRNSTSTSGGLNRRSRRAFETTVTEESAIDAAARIGLSRTPVKG